MAQEPSPLDFRLRVVAIALEPALMLARMALPLDDLQQLVTIGFFREARARGMSLRTIARRFNKSLRTIATLSRRSADDVILVEGSRRLALRRRAVELLAARGELGLELWHALAQDAAG